MTERYGYGDGGHEFDPDRSGRCRKAGGGYCSGAQSDSMHERRGAGDPEHHVHVAGDDHSHPFSGPHSHGGVSALTFPDPNDRLAASPFGFDVTDADMDAPDGARMTFERHGGRWEPVRVGPDEGLQAALERIMAVQPIGPFAIVTDELAAAQAIARNALRHDAETISFCGSCGTPGHYAGDRAHPCTPPSKGAPSNAG